MQIKELNELKKFVKKTLKNKKIKKEGSTTAGAGGYDTPKAFVGSEDGEPGKKALAADYTYTIKPAKEKRNFIKIHEISYKAFKEDQSSTDIQKVNNAIFEINRKIREINKVLDHSIKLKNESKIDDTKLWKKTNEALVKISKRMNEAAKKTRKFANLREIQANQIKEKLKKAFSLAGITLGSDDISTTQQGSVYVVDIYIDGEPYGFNVTNGQVYYEDYDKEESLGFIDNQQELVDNITKIFK